MWYVHTIDYYSVIKKKEISIHATTWMNLENMLKSSHTGCDGTGLQDPVSRNKQKTTINISNIS
jgi:hypothetical protein